MIVTPMASSPGGDETVVEALMAAFHPVHPTRRAGRERALVRPMTTDAEGWSRLWSGPAAYPSSEIAKWCTRSLGIRVSSCSSSSAMKG
jgi:hypothetical protein